MGWFSSDTETAAAAGENVRSGIGQENVDGRPGLFRGVVSAKQMNESQLVVHGVRKVNLSPEGEETPGSMTGTEHVHCRCPSNQSISGRDARRIQKEEKEIGKKELD